MNHKKELLSYKFSELRQIQTWLSDVQTLETQLQNTTLSEKEQASQTLAMLLLQSDILANSVRNLADNPLNLDLTYTDLITSPTTLADVSRLLDTLEARQIKTEEAIKELSADLLDTSLDENLLRNDVALDNLIQTLDEAYLLQASAESLYSSQETLIQNITLINQEISAIEANIEVQTALRRELEQERDLVWENYTTVQRKLAEIELSDKLSNSQVRVVAQAIPPRKPAGPSNLLVVAIAGLLSIITTTVIVFIYDYWRNNARRD